MKEFLLLKEFFSIFSRVGEIFVRIRKDKIKGEEGDETIVLEKSVSPCQRCSRKPLF